MYQKKVRKSYGACSKAENDSSAINNENYSSGIDPTPSKLSSDTGKYPLNKSQPSKKTQRNPLTAITGKRDISPLQKSLKANKEAKKPAKCVIKEKPITAPAKGWDELTQSSETKDVEARGVPPNEDKSIEYDMHFPSLGSEMDNSKSQAAFSTDILSPTYMVRSQVQKDLADTTSSIVLNDEEKPEKGDREREEVSVSEPKEAREVSQEEKIDEGNDEHTEYEAHFPMLGEEVETKKPTEEFKLEMLKPENIEESEIKVEAVDPTQYLVHEERQEEMVPKDKESEELLEEKTRDMLDLELKSENREIINKIKEESEDIIPTKPLLEGRKGHPFIEDEDEVLLDKDNKASEPVPPVQEIPASDYRIYSKDVEAKEQTPLDTKLDENFEQAEISQGLVDTVSPGIFIKDLPPPAPIEPVNEDIEPQPPVISEMLESFMAHEYSESRIKEEREMDGLIKYNIMQEELGMNNFEDMLASEIEQEAQITEEIINNKQERFEGEEQREKQDEELKKGEWKVEYTEQMIEENIHKMEQEKQEELNKLVNWATEDLDKEEIISNNQERFEGEEQRKKQDEELEKGEWKVEYTEQMIEENIHKMEQEKPEELNKSVNWATEDLDKDTESDQDKKLREESTAEGKDHEGYKLVKPKIEYEEEIENLLGSEEEINDPLKYEEEEEEFQDYQAETVLEKEKREEILVQGIPCPGVTCAEELEPIEEDIVVPAEDEDVDAEGQYMTQGSLKELDKNDVRGQSTPQSRSYSKLNQKSSLDHIPEDPGSVSILYSGFKEFKVVSRSGELTLSAQRIDLIKEDIRKEEKRNRPQEDLFHEVGKNLEIAGGLEKARMYGAAINVLKKNLDKLETHLVKHHGCNVQEINKLLAECNVRVADCYYNIRNFCMSIQHSRKALHYDSKDIKAMYILGISLIKCEDHIGGYAALKEARHLPSTSSDEDMYHELVNIELRKYERRIEEAKKEMEQKKVSEMLEDLMPKQNDKNIRNSKKETIIMGLTPVGSAVASGLVGWLLTRKYLNYSEKRSWAVSIGLGALVGGISMYIMSYRRNEKLNK